mmetsp:Transcript_5366/g.13553  ORF Transcript_5366/g.13553 Transcript_5366/m.13553 type:complete len:289 (+) Transcript_5366:3197-4063(+)
MSCSLLCQRRFFLLDAVPAFHAVLVFVQLGPRVRFLRGRSFGGGGPAHDGSAAVGLEVRDCAVVVLAVILAFRELVPRQRRQRLKVEVREKRGRLRRIMILLLLQHHVPVAGLHQPQFHALIVGHRPGGRGGGRCFRAVALRLRRQGMHRHFSSRVQFHISEVVKLVEQSRSCRGCGMSMNLLLLRRTFIFLLRSSFEFSLQVQRRGYCARELPATGLLRPIQAPLSPHLVLLAMDREVGLRAVRGGREENQNHRGSCRGRAWSGGTSTTTTRDHVHVDAQFCFCGDS